LGMVRKAPVYCDGNRITKLLVEKRLILTLAPGSYHFQTGKVALPIEVVGKAGEKVFLEIAFSFSWTKTKFVLRQVDRQ